MTETLGGAQELAQKFPDGDKNLIAALPEKLGHADFAEKHSGSFVAALEKNPFVSNYCASKRETA